MRIAVARSDRARLGGVPPPESVVVDADRLNWSYIDDTILITFWITGVVFAAVVLFMAYCVFRFRHREGSRAAYQPESTRLEWWLSIGTGVGVAAMLAPGLFVWDQFVTVPKDATTVEVVGQQ
jgi:cytochrome c oxidase subunit 2